MKQTVIGLFLMLFCWQVSLSQTIEIKGVVTDAEGSPLPGVSVLVKGTKKGTQTDFNGNYSLDTEKGKTLVFSYIGMSGVEKKIMQSQTLNITLRENLEELEAVVVTTGYQNVKKERMTGAVAIITSKDIKDVGSPQMDQILTGKIAGISAVSSGQPGAEATIRIRGNNSLSGNANPVWIVDGMPLQGEAPDVSSYSNIDKSLFQNGLGNIPPSDIESITVLKDAAATAIYGARAANGVIVVTTKSGMEGKPRYSLSFKTGFRARPVNNLHLMNSQQKIQFERELYNETGISSVGRVSYLLKQVDYGTISAEEAERQIRKLENTNTDWFKELYRPGFFTQTSASMSGGNKKTRYYNSFDFLNEEGTEYNNDYKRLRLNTKFDHNLSETLKIYGQLTATYKQNKSTASYIPTFGYAINANPYETPNGYDQSYDMKRSKIREGFQWEHLNALSEIKNNTASSRYLDAGLNAKIEWIPITGLNISSQASVYANSINTRVEEGENTYTNFKNNWIKKFIDSELTPDQVLGSLKEGTSYGTDYTIRNSISYDFNLQKRHFFTLFAGQELSAKLNYGSYNYSPIFDKKHRIVGFPELSKGVDIKTVNVKYSELGDTSRLESRFLSYFMNGSYSYQDRYVFSGSIRYDGSDVIGNKNQFTPLWNVSTKWNLHKENFWKKSKVIDELSLRAGYGFTGSIDKNAFPFIVASINNRYEYDGQIVPDQFVYSNPNIRWQTKKDINFGLDASLWNGLTQIRVDYYNNFVFDLLDNHRLPMSSGRKFVVQNIANLVNRGWEVELSVSPIRKDNMYWNIRANLAINENIVKTTFYKSTEDLPRIEDDENVNKYFVEEYPVGAWFGYRFAKVDPKTGATFVYTKDGDTFNMDKLQNQSLQITAPDPEYLGVKNPPITGGFSTDFSWNRWFVSMNFEFKMGNLIPSYYTYGSINSHNQDVTAVNRWKSAGDIAKYPKLFDNEAFSKYMYDVKLEKGDYLRATYFSFGRNLPDEFLKAMGCEYAKVSLGVTNLFTLTNYKGMDPSQLGYVSYPNSRRYDVSLSFSF